jgi:DNA-binding transcriptional ArsR family regulator
VQTDRLSVILGAWRTRRGADPGAARRREATVTELAEPFAVSLPAVSKHLMVLERAG